MYKRWQDGHITSVDYKEYLNYVEELERQAHERFMNNIYMK